MTAPLGAIELRPSSELMLLLDAIHRATDRLANAIEASNRIAGPVAADQQAAANVRAPGAGESAAHVPAPANPPAITDTDKSVAERPSGSRDSPAQIAALDARMWTPERNAVLRRDYPAGVSIDVILEKLHFLPGKVVPRERVAIQASKLGFNRRGLIKPAAAPTVDLSGLSTLGAVVERKAVPTQLATSPPPQKPQAAPQPKSRMEALMAVSRAVNTKPVADDFEPVLAGFEAVRKWAGERGMPFATWDDLPMVNTKREQLGLPRFKREFPMRGVFG